VFVLKVNSIVNYWCRTTGLKCANVLFRNIIHTLKCAGFFPDLDSLKCEFEHENSINY
jgi:hypothetical protein